MRSESKVLRFNSIVTVLSLLSIILPAQISKGVKLEFDEGASSASASVAMSVYAGAESDTDTWQDPGIVYDHNMAVYTAVGGAWSSGSASIHSDVNDAYSDEDGYIDDAKLFEFVYNQHFVGCPFEDSEHNITPASFSVQLDASGNLYWNLVPSNPNEKEGDLVAIGFWDMYSNGSNSTNMIYHHGTSKEYWVGSQKLGPYHVDCFCPSCDCNGNDPHGPIGLVVRLGDKIKLSYNANDDGHSNDNTEYSDYVDSAYGESLRLKIKAKVQPLNVTFLDKRWLSMKNLLGVVQDREELSQKGAAEVKAHAIVKGACADGTTQLILLFDLSDWSLLFEPNDIPADTETPTCVRLSILSLYGKDNGKLVVDGDDNDNDGYNDTPRIKDGTFTQTWIAPPVFDSVLGSANKEKMRKIPIQIKIDKDGDGNFEYTFIRYIELIRTPVILVHGWRPVRNIWNTLKNHIETAGITVIPFDYYNIPPIEATGNPQDYAQLLNLWFCGVREHSEYAGKFDIVCHSMGALVSRWFMEKLDGGKNAEYIRQWIGIAPVNNGSGLADIQRLFGWTKIKNLIPLLHNMNIPFVIEKAVTEMRTGSKTVKGIRDTINPNVKYRVIAGVNSKELPPASNTPPFRGPFGGKTIFVKWWFLPWLTSRGDGMITLENARIENHDIDCLRIDHNALLDNEEVCAKVISYILNPSTPSANNVPGEEPSDSQRLILGAEKGDMISIGETHNTAFTVDGRTERITVGIDWAGSDMNLTLVSPSGTVLEPNTSSVSEYCKTDAGVWYTIDAPEVGEWTAQVEAVNVPSEGEQFWFRTLHSSSVSLEVTTDANRQSYHIGENATVVAKIADGNELVAGAIVNAQIKRPDSSIEEIVLYDDGTHGDTVPDDGFYCNQVLLVQLGAYEITVSAIGTINSMPFERIMPLAIWVVIPEDFNYDSVVDFSDFSLFALQWLKEDCNEPNWCEGADFDKNGDVGLNDLAEITDNWLEGI